MIKCWDCWLYWSWRWWILLFSSIFKCNQI